MSKSLSWVQQARKRLANHLVNQTPGDFTMPSIASVNPFSRYVNAVDRDNVARSAPVMIMPSSLLPPGHVVADHLLPTDTPVIVYRDPKTLELKSYVNQCKHRGAPFLKPTPEMTPTLMKGSALRCPYHGWAYDVRTGDLKAVTAESSGVFPCLDKKSHGLASLPCFEKAGGIFVGGQDMVENGLWSGDESDYELSPLMLAPDDPNCGLVGFREWYLKANWQLVVETFLEAYHVNFLHEKTIALVSHSPHTVMVTDRLDGRSLRLSIPLEKFDTESALNADDEELVSAKDPYFSQTTMLYTMFPNTTVGLFKRFCMILTIVPVGDSSDPQSRVRVWGFTHGTSVGSDPEAQKRDFEGVLAGVEEDWDCAEGIQRGLRADTVLHSPMVDWRAAVSVSYRMWKKLLPN